jgi:uncharacterized damage-inducible protein DinB
MDSRNYLADLARQMEWADAYIWTSVLASPVASSDPRLLATFYHLHFSQHFFCQAWTNGPTVVRESREFTTATDLAEWARDAHLKLQAFLDAVDPAALDGDFREPWTDQFEARFPRPASPHTLAESVVQVILHTAHHRGQACTRLRELGCQPPTVDFIVWLWAGKPEPDWACIGQRSEADQSLQA